MTDKQINAAIAEACGWGQKPVVNTDRGRIWVTNCPNYCADLNAMHDAEKELDSGELFRGYYLALYDITKSTRMPVCATARQRAEAFLRTIGKWEEAK